MFNEPNSPVTLAPDDPLAGPTSRFATGRPLYAVPESAEAPSDVRPFGMRLLKPVGTTDPTPPTYRYDPERQVSVGDDGVPLYQADRPHTTTGSNDGNGNPQEEWTYD